MKQYLDLVAHVLRQGVRKPNRTGVDTLSTFGHYYEHDLADGFPLLTTKRVSWKNIVVEMLWFLSGSTNVEILRRHGCKFWDAWADGDGAVPSAYGSFWRSFPEHTRDIPYIDSPLEIDDTLSRNDQIRWVVDEARRNPMSRRMVVSAWSPGNAQASKLPPCHCMFVLNVQKALAYSSNTHAEPDFVPEQVGEERRLCLHLTQRSCDVAVGVPYNLASYALLLHLFSRFTGIEPGIFGHSLVDAHVYTSKSGEAGEEDHVPGLLEQLRRAPRRLPRLILSPDIVSLESVEELMHLKITTAEVMSHFRLEGYDPHPEIKFKVAV